MTPYAKAQDILDKLVAAASADGHTLPDTQYAVLGEPVVDCEAVIVGLSGSSPAEDFPTNCAVPEIGDFSIIIAHDCASMYDAQGRTITSEAAAVASQQSDDGDFLWSFANGYAEYLSKSWSLGYAVTGGLALASLTLNTGID